MDSKTASRQRVTPEACQQGVLQECRYLRLAWGDWRWDEALRGLDIMFSWVCVV